MSVPPIQESSYQARGRLRPTPQPMTVTQTRVNDTAARVLVGSGNTYYALPQNNQSRSIESPRYRARF